MWSAVWWRGFRESSRVVALDLGSHSVKLVAVRRAGTLRIDAAVLGELPAGVVHGHVVRQPAAVAEVIKGLLRKSRTRVLRAVTAVPGAAVMMRRLVVHATPGPSLDAAIVREAAALVPDALEHAVLDYQVLGPAAAEGALHVLVVAARRDLVRSYTAALRAAGLEPCGVDVDVFALDRLRRTTSGDASDDAPVALVHVGARRADVTVVGGDGPVFVGDVPAGGAHLDAELLADQIQRALDLFRLDAASPIATVVLSGGAAGTPGLAAALGVRLRCAVALSDPFLCVEAGPRLDRARLAPVASAFAVAIGLGLRHASAT